MLYQRILVEKSNTIATLTLNRPEKHNALDMLFFQEFDQCMNELNEDKDTRAVIITGAGRSFCSGIDVTALAQAAADPDSMGKGRLDLSQPFGPLQVMPTRLRSCHKPTIAAINGLAAGVGMALICLCDFRIASENATFAPGFINLGLAGELGLTYLLPRITSLPMALEFMSTGETRDARWAEMVGLVRETVSPDGLMQAAQGLASKLVTMPPLALGMVKQLIHQGQQADFETHLQSEAFAASLLLHTDDLQEAMLARLEKRPPVFKGT